MKKSDSISLSDTRSEKLQARRQNWVGAGRMVNRIVLLAIDLLNFSCRICHIHLILCGSFYSSTTPSPSNLSLLFLISEIFKERSDYKKELYSTEASFQAQYIKFYGFPDRSYGKYETLMEPFKLNLLRTYGSVIRMFKEQFQGIKKNI